MNPLWGVLVVNVVALVMVPFLTYRFAHKNNLKLVEERWIAEVSQASADYVEACHSLVFARTLQVATAQQAQAARIDGQALSERIDRHQASIAARGFKLSLLFEECSKDWKEIEKAAESLTDACDKSEKGEDVARMSPQARIDATANFKTVVSKILQLRWNKVRT